MTNKQMKEEISHQFSKLSLDGKLNCLFDLMLSQYYASNETLQSILKQFGLQVEIKTKKK